MPELKFNNTNATPVMGVTPTRSATVQASAGSGKTWLLVTRLLRLLLAGEPAGDIVALTFTRKAAGEMQQRLRERLRNLAIAPEDQLQVALTAIGLDTDTNTLNRARGAFEQLLLAPFALRTLTFHSFCQDILQQFAIEANLPSGFGLLEDEDEVIDVAWFTLLHQLTAQQDSTILTRYIDAIGSMASAEKALHGFLQHRLDWWAYEQACRDENASPSERLTAYFQPPENERAVYADCFKQIAIADLEYYAAVLQAWGRTTGLQNRAKVLLCMNSIELDDQFRHLHTAVLTQTGTLRKYSEKTIAAEAEKAGLSGEHFFELHAMFAELLLDADDALKRYHNHQLNHDWQVLGQQFVALYQDIKAERGVLDFADLEWHTVQLLTHAELGPWVQYKLDQRVAHILIDEFQDTSPTQWTLLYPLLEEIVANDAMTHNTTHDQKHSSLFIVGDDKQSIYGFRRADPALLGNADRWVREQTAHHTQPAEPVTLAKSYRSSAAIMNVTNAVFSDVLPNFPLHATHRDDLWGQVTLLPAIHHSDTPDDVVPSAPNDAIAGLRNPLTTPREASVNSLPALEAEQIATQIQRLMTQALPVKGSNGNRAANYGDIMILLRKRTHAAPIEHALRQADIPFMGADRDSFSSSLEIQDLQALLRLLNSPWDNLACAQVLRSPLFSWDDADIIQLAQAAADHQTTNWLHTLIDAPSAPAEEFDPRATRLLRDWLELAAILPTHDLLDRIFRESAALPRYRAAYPPDLHARLEANFQHLIQLSLATDGGRYPSLRRFHEKISATRTAVATRNHAVQIMTIHAAKGLEAPIVFIANTADYHTPQQTWQPVVHWPAGQSAPSQILLRPSKAKMEQNSEVLITTQQEREAREQHNLLYVALTRAQQYCWISGFRGQRSSDQPTWWDQLHAGMQQLEASKTPDGQLTYQHGESPTLISQSTNAELVADINAPRSSGQSSGEPASNEHASDNIAPTAFNEQKHRITPSQNGAAGADGRIELDGSTDSRLRGIAIHSLIEHLSAADTPNNPSDALQQAAAVTGIRSDDSRWPDWVDEAQRVVQQVDWAWLFSSQAGQAWNELPIYTGNIYGIVDRVVCTQDTVYCVDYKTQRNGASPELIEHYQHQLAAYRHALKTIWPKHKIKTYLLFTATLELIETTL